MLHCNENHKIFRKPVLLPMDYSYYIHILETSGQMELENLNGILSKKSILLPPFNAVMLTRPGAVRPESDHPFPAFCPVCVMRLI